MDFIKRNSNRQSVTLLLSTEAGGQVFFAAQLRAPTCQGWKLSRSRRLFPSFCPSNFTFPYFHSYVLYIYINKKLLCIRRVIYSSSSLSPSWMQIPFLLAATKVFFYLTATKAKHLAKGPAAQALRTCSPTLVVFWDAKSNLFIIQVGAQGIKHFSHSHCWVGCALENCRLWMLLRFKLCGMHSNNICHRDSLIKGRTAKVKRFESASRFNKFSQRELSTNKCKSSDCPVVDQKGQELQTI